MYHSELHAQAENEINRIKGLCEIEVQTLRQQNADN